MITYDGINVKVQRLKRSGLEAGIALVAWWVVMLNRC